MTEFVRAAHNPRPPGHVDDWTTFHRSAAHAAEDAAAAGWQFWADISEFQRIVTKAYPYRLLAIRLDTGYRIDNNAIVNRAAAEKIKTIEALIGYPVFVPGQSKQILTRLKKAFGNTDPGFAVMTDMESGQGFAGPGNHSSEANDFQAELADWTGSRARELGYANAGDWANCWRSRPRWMKRILANYSSIIVPGYWAQQYKGGGNTPVPAGFPTACKPFGSWVDLNARKTTVPALLDDLGLDWLTMATQAQVKALLDTAAKTIVEEMNAKFVAHEKTIVELVDKHVDAVLGRVTHDGDHKHPEALVHIEAAVTAIAAKVGATVKS